ncbi:MADS-box domain-containing protein [Plasmodiophora brassicae]
MTMIALCCSVQQRVLLSMISIVATVLLAASTAGRRFALLSDVDRIHFVEAEAGAVHFTFLKQLLGTGDAGVWPIPIRTDIPDPILATVAAFINENSAPDVHSVVQWAQCQHPNCTLHAQSLELMQVAHCFKMRWLNYRRHGEDADLEAIRGDAGHAPRY